MTTGNMQLHPPREISKLERAAIALEHWAWWLLLGAIGTFASAIALIVLISLGVFTLPASKDVPLASMADIWFLLVTGLVMAWLRQVTSSCRRPTNTRVTGLLLWGD